MFSVFAAMTETVYEPIIADIAYDVDVEARRGEVHVEGVFDVVGQPIRNPVTGQEHRARIDLPHGFEYEVAEIGSASSKSRGKVALDLKNTYAQFARLHLNNKGVVRHRATA
jgi:hypothetical protein